MDTELAWAAGFFDGEGTIGCYSQPARLRSNGTTIGRPRLRLCITQNRTDSLARFQHALGGLGSIGACRPRTGCYQFNVYADQDVRRALSLLWPYLSGAKRAQTLAALATFAARSQRVRAALAG